MIYNTIPTKHTRMFTPGDAPVLVRSQFAGNDTTSVGDRGAAVLDEMTKMSALLFGDLGATRCNHYLPLRLKQQRIVTTLDARRTLPSVSDLPDSLIGHPATLSVK
jgi:hypothetical protein